MTYYVLEVPHAAEDHERAVTEVLRQAPGCQLLFFWGCRVGDHKAWAIVEADSHADALDNVPYFLRARASAHRVEAYDVDHVLGVWEYAG